ncbi:hypothetical protein ABT272_40630 [Streptomyces sp900105245]|uniref:Helicase n=1 Tax=Streptomyces sp. 900105245 TaxID=3154379 RepID=A0ABV1UJQ7_9ACTN
MERLEDGTEVKLGVFLSNTKTRRARLTTDQLRVLAALGLDWAQQTLTEPPQLQKNGVAVIRKRGWDQKTATP